MQRSPNSGAPFLLCFCVACIAKSMYIECMSKIPKEATVEQAKQMLAQNSFVYNNPCCVCQKQCSTPTREIWLRRINEFGSVQNMYANYKCRKCRKHAPKPTDVQLASVEPLAPVIIKEPMMSTTKMAPMMQAKEQRPLVQIKPVKPQREPGTQVQHKPGHFAFSVWEDGIFKGTTWHKYSDKQVD